MAWAEPGQGNSIAQRALEIGRAASMIAATLAGSWRVSGGFAEGRQSGTRRSEGAEEQVEGLVLFVTTGPSSWFFLACYVLAAVRTQGNTMFRRGSTQKS